MSLSYAYFHVMKTESPSKPGLAQAQMEEKERQIAVLQARHIKRRPILPIIASGLAVCEKRAAEEVGGLSVLLWYSL